MAWFLGGCTYIEHTIRQREYRSLQRTDPQMRTLKHMVNRGTFFVYGQLLPPGPHQDPPIDRLSNQSLIVAALSNDLSQGEVVDLNLGTRAGSYYGLNLPPGSYTLVVMADRDGDRRLVPGEAIGSAEIRLSLDEDPSKVAGSLDIPLSGYGGPPFGAVELPATAGSVEEVSLFYPKGTIRPLTDPIFSQQMATLGLYEPAAFLETAPMMFYALEEDRGHLVPVVFVHGIDGSAADFSVVVDRLDRTRYKPWFFHYPSGADLEQTAEFFAEIFLSGKVVRSGKQPMIVVAHSMGGLVVREALNRIRPSKRTNRVELLITLASPFGGHPSAKMAVRAPSPLPSWLDLNPESEFIRQLFRQPLPKGVKHHLFYGTGASEPAESSEGDGVVPLSSQLREAARSGAAETRGFPSTHEGILTDGEPIEALIRLISDVNGIYPADHLQYLDMGGYTGELPPSYSDRDRFVINNFAHYLDAFTRGKLAPLDEDQEHFLRVVRGQARPKNYFESAWLKFMTDFPDGIP